MRVFFDTEFTRLRQNTMLISVGCVSDDETTFYAEFNDYDQSQVDDWVREHVFPNLIMSEPKIGEQEFYSKSRWQPEVPATQRWCVQMRGTRAQISHELWQWFGQFDLIEIWGDCLAYDWVLICELFGGSSSIPQNVYHIPFDLSTALKLLGIDPDVDREHFSGNVVRLAGKIMKHNALWDALAIRGCYHEAMAKYRGATSDKTDSIQASN